MSRPSVVIMTIGLLLAGETNPRVMITGGVWA
jgi:hypothetical protein